MPLKDPTCLIHGPHIYVTNIEVRNRIQHAIERHETNLLTTVKRRKLKWYGHVSRIIRPDQDHFARHCEASKEKGETKEAVGR